MNKHFDFVVDQGRTGPNVFNTVQAAIDAASERGGKTSILIRKGVYRETLHIPLDGDIELTGEAS